MTTTVLQQLEQFLASASAPGLLEPGEPILSLTDTNHSFESRSSHVLFQAWEDHRTLSRRVVRATARERGKLELAVQLFGGKEGKMFLLDLANPNTREWRTRGRKLEFRERFRKFLAREFPEWRIAELTAEANLQHSLSPAFPRSLLVRGNRAIAAIAAPQGGDHVAAALTFGLIWLAYLRGREEKLAVEELLLLLPEGEEKQTALRLAYLSVPVQLYIYNEDDAAIRVDPRDAGNLDAALSTCHRVPPAQIADDAELFSVPGFEQVSQPDGTASLRIYGLEFARLPGKATAGEIVTYARELSRLRCEPGSMLHAEAPERWMESRVRSAIEQIDPTLRAAPLYGQAPAFTAGDRGIADLLAIDNRGQLAVVELKASEDIHLPLQALDYWMRVAGHAAKGDFTKAGYFPGITVLPMPPKLLLVAPSIQFHSTAETILSFFRSSIDVCRVGLSANWREEVKPMFRLRGADRPT